MAPYFIRNFVPRGEKVDNARPLLVALREVTWIQWGLYFSGYEWFFSRLILNRTNLWPLKVAILDLRLHRLFFCFSQCYPSSNAV